MNVDKANFCVIQKKTNKTENNHYRMRPQSANSLTLTQTTHRQRTRQNINRFYRYIKDNPQKKVKKITTELLNYINQIKQNTPCITL